MCKNCTCKSKAAPSMKIFQYSDPIVAGASGADARCAAAFDSEVRTILDKLKACEYDAGGAVSEIREECNLLLGRLGYEYPV